MALCYYLSRNLFACRAQRIRYQIPLLFWSSLVESTTECVGYSRRGVAQFICNWRTSHRPIGAAYHDSKESI